MSVGYQEFLARKRRAVERDGIEVAADDLHRGLFDWQRRIVSWALNVGLAAIWTAKLSTPSRRKVTPND